MEQSAKKPSGSRTAHSPTKCKPSPSDTTPLALLLVSFLLLLFRFLFLLLEQLFPLAPLLLVLLALLLVQSPQLLNVALEQLLIIAAHVQYLEVGLVQLQQRTALDRMLHEGRYVMIQPDTEQPLADLCLGWDADAENVANRIVAQFGIPPT